MADHVDTPCRSRDELAVFDGDEGRSPGGEYYGDRTLDTSCDAPPDGGVLTKQRLIEITDEIDGTAVFLSGWHSTWDQLSKATWKAAS